VNRRLVHLLLALATPALEQAVQSAPKSAAALQIAGKRYLRITDWAKNNGLQFRWLKQEETMVLSNSDFRIHLKVNSSEAEFNDVIVRLLYPAALREGVPFLSELDIQNTFAPLLNPPRNRAGLLVKKICVDAGHGGDDPGYHSGPNQEKKFALLLAQELRDQLAKAGFKVSMTRTSDKRVELADRSDVARRKGADAFISVHFNAFTEHTVQGTEVYCLTPAGAPSTNARGEGAGAGSFTGNKNNEKNMLLAFQMQKSLTQSLKVEDRGVHRARFEVLREAEMPAVLIEGGFLSHVTEGKKILDPGYRRQMARAVVDGLLAYKKQVERK
jgi:N-acetylmuramoyl-L-alanine amidase